MRYIYKKEHIKKPYPINKKRDGTKNNMQAKMPVVTRKAR